MRFKWPRLSPGGTTINLDPLHYISYQYNFNKLLKFYKICMYMSMIIFKIVLITSSLDV